MTYSTRHACTCDTHLPNCYNPTPYRHAPNGCTACACGALWWLGNVGSWHSHEIRETTGWTTAGNPIYQTLGWERYYLHAAGCSDDRIEPDEGHVCSSAEPIPSAEFWRVTP